MKLYVWEGVLEDYTSGIIIILARDNKDAVAKLREQSYSDRCEGLVIEGVKPEIIDASRPQQAKEWHVYGGG